MGGQTNAGLPYPAPTEPVAAGADNIKALAQAVDPYVYTISGTAGITWGQYWRAAATNWEPFTLSRIGKTVWAHGVIVLTQQVSISAGSEYVLATLPVGFRPPAGLWPFRSVGLSPLVPANPAWAVVRDNGELRYSQTVSGTYNAANWLLGFDLQFTAV